MSSLETIVDHEVQRQLRDATRDAHAALHGVAAFASLLAGDMTPGAYRALMQRLHDFYATLDPRLERGCAELLHDRHGFSYAPRAPRLAADLSALGAATTLGGEQPRLPDLTARASLLGALYVVEGSLLGASVLARGAARVLAQGDAQATAGLGYWTWSRRVAATRWQQTLGLLQVGLATPRDLASAGDTARGLFAALHAWLHPASAPTC